MDLSRPLKDELVLDCGTYALDLSFNRVFKLIEMLSDKEVFPIIKGYVGLMILTDVNFEEVLAPQEALEVLQLVIEEHIQPKTDKVKPIEYDLMGNPLPQLKQEEEDDIGDERPLFSFKHDSDYIYASFMQAYGIDLIDKQDNLHWRKFNALLNGLPDNTKFMNVLRIRSWKPSKHDDAKYKEEMRKLQNQYGLPDDSY
ncbi:MULTISPECIES: Gp15 family bacteriophage protein [unclassified Facklamia]|uniref:Gp15 family bacteriophage protein n=1 Tax=Aerococcaceae TaxID=186827 RepID=UPI0013B9ED04|nr:MULTISPECIES: Gp15 family bacteriophage protein [unclassified Facklamia]NEW64251.1 hypothetical protein [Facklamia sp. 252]NEW68766.1 hypothetical protein [Facklamia sp. 253]QQD64718.1 hypothetical protein JDW14_05105 [Aerococcaceae bacterium zg-252]